MTEPLLPIRGTDSTDNGCAPAAVVCSLFRFAIRSRSCAEHLTSFRFARLYCQLLRTSLKRSTPSFTVEVRQSKRPRSGSPQTSWVDEKLAATAPITEPKRIAASAFKLVADNPPMESLQPPLVSRRILPSLIDLASQNGTTLAAEDEPRNEKRAKTRTIRSGESGKAGYRRKAARAETSTDQLGVSDAASSKAPTAHVEERAPRPPVRAVKTSKPEKPASRPADRLHKFEGVRSAPAIPVAIAPVSSPSDAPPVSDSVAGGRKARVLSRYVFRNDSTPGSAWKRRIQEQRQRRGA